MLSVNGVNFAVRDFVLDSYIAIHLQNRNGEWEERILSSGKEYFSYYEIMAIQREGKLPKGFRLPTADEFRALSYSVTIDDLIGQFGFSLGGFIQSGTDGGRRRDEMDKYNEDCSRYPYPQDGNVDVREEVGRFGYYWTSDNVVEIDGCVPGTAPTAYNKLFAKYLIIPRSDNPVVNIGIKREIKGNGMRVRLVSEYPTIL